jgi:hypothetical protein
VNTESRHQGERRPEFTLTVSTGGKNRPFSTGGFTDRFTDSLPSFAGTYESVDSDNSVFGPSNVLDNILNAVVGGFPKNQTERRSEDMDREREEYNMEQGPGTSSSRPKYPTNARDNVRENSKFLKKALGKRRTPREGGVPKANRK